MNKENQTFTLSDGRLLGYAEYGDPKGKPLLYFHGWPSSRLRGESFDTAAKNAKARVISIDRPGYGLSTFQKNRTLLDWPRDVVELMDFLKIKTFSVMGVSGGGPYAAAVAYKIPERLYKVGIVVGLAPTWIPGALEGMPYFARIGWRNYSRVPFLAFLASLQWYVFTNFPIFQSLVPMNKEDKKILRPSLFKKDTKLAEAFRQGIKGVELDLLLYTHDWGFEVKNIKARTFLWYADMDTSVTLKMAQYYAKEIKDSTLKVYKGEGHMISRTHAEEILKTLVS